MAEKTLKEKLTLDAAEAVAAFHGDLARTMDFSKSARKKVIKLFHGYRRTISGSADYLQYVFRREGPEFTAEYIESMKGRPMRMFDRGYKAAKVALYEMVQAREEEQNGI